MNSVSRAMLWELMVRGRWQIPGWFIFGNLIPGLLYTAFGHLGVDYEDPALVAMHVILLQLMMLLFGLGIVGAQGALSRMFLLPVSTATVVAWHLIPGSILLSVEVAIALVAQNAYFGLNQPVVGPTLFAATVWASAQMLVGMSHRTLKSVLLASAPSVLSFCWFGSRYGGWFRPPFHYWAEVTLVEIFTLLISFSVFSVLTVRAIARDRCGEHFRPISFWKWVERTWEQFTWTRSERDKLFRSPMEAQLWYEWRSKGIALPTIVVAVIVFGGFIFLVRVLVVGNWTEPLKELQEVMVGGGFLLSIVAGVAGLLLGTTFSGIQSRNHSATIRDLNTQSAFDQMGSFLASRPITNVRYAEVILRTAIRSVAWSWGLWALLAAVAAVAGIVTETPLPPAISNLAPYWYLPGTLLAAWIGMTCVASAVLTGRFTRFSVAFVLMIFGAVLLNLLIDHYASPQARRFLGVLLSIIMSVVVLGGTMLAFSAALRNCLIASRSAGLCGVFWIALTAFAILFRPPALGFFAFPLISSFAALVVLPFATTPLAIAWNRHR